MHTRSALLWRSPGLVAVSLTFTACATAASPEASLPRTAVPELSAEALLAELNPRGGAAIVQAWHGDDPEAVAAFYTEDAVVVADAETVYRGRAEILSGFLRPLVGVISALTPTIEQVIGGPEQMTLIGRYTARVDPDNGAPYEGEGVFGNTWTRQTDGSWKIRASISTPPAPPRGAGGGTHRTMAGEAVRVVRFHVKPDQREEFERFFRESLRPAAARREGVPAGAVELGGFRLLIPAEMNQHGHFTYYVLVDPLRGPLGSGEVMRDLVREAFPGADGEERVRRWMRSIVLEPPFDPRGETFIEGDLLRPDPRR